MVNYYKVCRRELWFYMKQVNINYDNDDINIGSLIHDKYYKREKKEVCVDNMVFDFIKTKNNELIISEVKKSSMLTVGAEYQLYFYLYILRDYNPIGELKFPTENKTKKLYLTKEIEDEMELIMDEILSINSLDKPPEIINKPYCKKCSFHDLCMV